MNKVCETKVSENKSLICCDPWLLSTNYTLEPAALGETLFGYLWSGIHRDSGKNPTPVAIKMSILELVTQGKTKYGRKIHEDLEKECRIMQILKNTEYVMPLLACFSSSTHHYMVMPLGCCDLYEQLQNPLEIGTAKKYFYQLLSAVCSIHTKNIVHLDLSLENIIVTSNDDILVTDFGLSQFSHPETKVYNTSGKQKYMCPEMIAVQPFDGRSADVFAMGVILFNLLTGFTPFESASPNDQIYQIIRTRKLSFALSKWNIEMHPTAIHLLECMMSAETDRITVDEIFAHAFFN